MAYLTHLRPGKDLVATVTGPDGAAVEIRISGRDARVRTEIAVEAPPHVRLRVEDARKVVPLRREPARRDFLEDDDPDAPATVADLPTWKGA